MVSVLKGKMDHSKREATREKLKKQYDIMYESKKEEQLRIVVESFKNKTLYITDRSFPFREKYNLRPGKLRVINDKVTRPWGFSREEEEGIMTDMDNMVGSSLVASNYMERGGIFYVFAGIPTSIRYIRLTEEDIVLYGKEVVKVFLMSSYKTERGFVSMYVPDTEVRPQAALIEGERFIM